MKLRLRTVLTCITLVCVGCKEPKNSSNVASQESNELSSNELKALANKLNSLTPVETKLIDNSQLSDLVIELEKIVAVNVEKGSDPQWGELQKKLTQSKSEFLNLSQKYPTIGALRQAKGFKDYKDLAKNPAAIAAWQSDMDAFPVNVIFPNSIAGQEGGALHLSGDDGKSWNVTDRLFGCSFLPLFGSLSLILVASEKISGVNPSGGLADAIFVGGTKAMIRGCLTGSVNE